MKHVELFTDGACLGNPGRGGYAALLRYGKHEKEISGAEAMTTNNRMELMAVIAGLDTLKTPCRVDIYTDSQYVQKGMSEWVHLWQRNGWKNASKKEVKNVDLWQLLLAAAERHDIRWHWVRGHNNHPENERVDALAREAALKI